jgi:hypothetical protein
MVGFDLTGFEGYAEPPMNPGGRQDPMKTKAYIRRSRPEPSLHRGFNDGEFASPRLHVVP